MGKTIITPFEVAEHIKTPQEIAAYLGSILEEADGEPSFITKTLEDIAHAKGIETADVNFLSMAGLWQDLDSTLKTIREEAWPRQHEHKMTTEQNHGMG